MTPHHDSQFGDLPCFLPGVSNVRQSTVLRIAELEAFGTGARLSAHVFFLCETNRMNEEMAVCVAKGHMRMLLPTAENGWRMDELAIECTHCDWIRIGGMGNGVREGRCPVYITQIGTACGMWNECPDTLSCAPQPYLRWPNQRDGS